VRCVVNHGVASSVTFTQVRHVEAVVASIDTTTHGDGYVLEQGVVRYIAFQPGAPTAATPAPVTGLGHVTSLVRSAGHTLALDDHGVWELRAARARPWPTDRVPTRLWAGGHLSFYTLEDGTLHQHVWGEDDKLDRVIGGVIDPVAVVLGLCVLERAGNVKCGSLADH
jgi:hypothetical protein